MGIWRQNKQRAVTMPRVRPEVEANKIQAPEIVRALQQRMGMRQMHTTPTMAAELVPVVLVDDLTKVSQQNSCRYRAHGPVGAAVNDGSWLLWNPPDHNRMVKVIGLWFQSSVHEILNFGLQDATTTPPGNVGIKPGQRMSRGIQPPDAQAWPNASRVRLFVNDNLQVLTGTFLEFHVGSSALSTMNKPLWMDMNIFLGPGSQFSIWQHGAASADCGVEWEESPLT